MSMNEQIVALANKIEAGLSVNEKTGVGEAKADVYHDNLPEGLTKEVVTQVSNYNSDFVAASTYAFGRMAVKAMADNPALNSAFIDITMSGKDTVSIETDRSRTFTKPGDDTKAEITKYGSTSVAYTVHAGKNAGQLKAARNALVDLATQALKG